MKTNEIAVGLTSNALTNHFARLVVAGRFLVNAGLEC
jgi:hypothetical protein